MRLERAEGVKVRGSQVMVRSLAVITRILGGNLMVV